MQIFLSYASEDKPNAEKIAFSLRARGHKVFLDSDDLPPGSEYDRRIEIAVGATDLFIFLVTPASVTKGRYTLTELEFARRKWRSADGHVLPVLLQSTDFETIPSFLKSVTILEPQGNVAAEVASTVDLYFEAATAGRVKVYGLACAASGLLTFIFNFAVQRSEGTVPVPVTFLAQSVPFALALIVSFSFFFRFQKRYFFIVPFVVIGFGAAVLFNLRTQSDVYVINFDFLKDHGLDPCLTDGNSVTCRNQKRVEELEASVKYWTVAVELMVSGAIGALFTACGSILAARRRISLPSFLLILAAGALTPALWFAISYDHGRMVDTGWQSIMLFMPWQVAVGSLIGRSIR